MSGDAVAAVALGLIGCGLTLGAFHSRPLGYACLLIAAVLGARWKWPQVFQRRSRPPAPRQRPPATTTDPGYSVLLPWMSQGQLVMTLQHRDADAERSSRPVAWKCELHTPSGRTWDCEDAEQLTAWKVEVQYPRDFPGAARPAPGRYEVVWSQGMYAQFTAKFAGWQELGRRTFTVTDAGRVDPA